MEKKVYWISIIFIGASILFLIVFYFVHYPNSIFGNQKRPAVIGGVKIIYITDKGFNPSPLILMIGSIENKVESFRWVNKSTSPCQIKGGRFNTSILQPNTESKIFYVGRDPFVGEYFCVGRQNIQGKIIARNY